MNWKSALFNGLINPVSGDKFTMYSAENYLWGMVAYYLGAALLMLCCWRFTRWIGWQWLRYGLLLLMAVLLLMPFTAYPDMDFFAPAWFVSLFEGLTKATEQGALRAGVPLLIGCIVAVALYFMVISGKLIYLRNSSRGKLDKPDTAEINEVKSDGE
jgi:hypothetical protein